jgi:hypothetical protein
MDPRSTEASDRGECYAHVVFLIPKIHYPGPAVQGTLWCHRRKRIFVTEHCH